VLFRTSSHSAELEIELTRRNIPFVKFGGLKFLDSAHIKDLLALLRFVDNPRDRVAGFRVLQLLPGVGPGTAGKSARPHGRPAPTRWLELLQASRPRRAARKAGRAARSGGASGQAAKAGWPAELELLRARMWYEPLMEAVYEDAMVRKEDIYQLEQIAAGYAEPRALLTELTLDPPDATSRPGRCAAARRGLPDPLDHPFGQGPGMEERACAERRRRLPSPPTSAPARRMSWRRSGGCFMWR
jgi:DNA helicase-2/ATP-dependent DNA helicase PcrA